MHARNTHGDDRLKGAYEFPIQDGRILSTYDANHPLKRIERYITKMSEGKVVSIAGLYYLKTSLYIYRADWLILFLFCGFNAFKFIPRVQGCLVML